MGMQHVFAIVAFVLAQRIYEHIAYRECLKKTPEEPPDISFSPDPELLNIGQKSLDMNTL